MLSNVLVGMSRDVQYLTDDFLKVLQRWKEEPKFMYMGYGENRIADYSRIS